MQYLRNGCRIRKTNGFICSLILSLSLLVSYLCYAQHDQVEVAVEGATTLATQEALLRSAENMQKSYPQKSRTIATSVYDVAKREGSKSLEVRSLIALGRLANDSRQLSDAKSYLREALAISQQMDDTYSIIHSTYNLADTCRFSGDFDCAHQAIDTGIATAAAVGDNEWLLRGHNIRGNIYKSAKDYSNALDSYFISLDYAEKYKFKTLTVRAHKNIATIYSRVEDIKSSVKHNQKALEIIKGIPDFDEALLAKHLEATVSNQRKLGEYSKVVQNALQLLSIYRRQENKQAVEKFLLNLSIAYRKLGIYDSALQYATELLTLNKHSGDLNGLASTNNQIAMVYVNLEQFENAEYYYRKTLEIAAEDMTKKNQASALRGLASVFHRQNNNVEALDYLGKAQALYEATNDLRGLESINRLFGEIQGALGNTETARRAHTQALAKSRDMHATWSEASNLIHLGRLNINDSPQQAEKLIKEGVDLAHAQSSKSLLTLGLSALIELAQSQGNHQSAYEHLNEKYTISREIYKKEVRQRIADLQVIREIEEKEKKINSLEKQAKIDSLELEQQSAQLDLITKENTIAKLKLEHEKVFRLLLIFLILLILIVLTVLYGRFRYSRSVQQVLYEKNKQIEAKNKKLEEINATKDRFLSIIAHDLKGPISALTALIDILKDDLDNYSQRQIRLHIDTIAEASKQTLNLVDELLEWAMLQVRQSEPVPRYHELSVLCHRSIKSVEASANAKNIHIDCKVDSALMIYADQNMIKTVIRNILSNAIKFTQTGGAINLFATEDDHYTTLHIRDNGVGIKSEHVDQLFDIDKKISCVGTEGEKGSGFGLALCREFIEKNGGKILVKSKRGEGSEFSFTSLKKAANPA